MPPNIRIGLSGWTYAPWRGTFFPRKLRRRDELAHASRQVASIEINGTFYSLQRPASYATWRDQTPDEFLFAVKGPRFITHLKRLKKIRTPLANFFASGVLTLGEKLGPILWQLPPHLAFNHATVDAFLTELPRTLRTAAALACEHDDKVKAVDFKIRGDRPLRYALEVRHASFVTPEFIALLRRHQVALVVADTAGKWPLMEDVTADFVYVRLHGDAELYVSGYTPRALAEWARKIRAWARGSSPVGAQMVGPRTKPSRAGRDVFVYFDNDVKTRAPYDAMNLAYRLKLRAKPGRAPSMASIAEQPRTRWPGLGPSSRDSR